MTSIAVLRGAQLLDNARPGWDLERTADGDYQLRDEWVGLISDRREPSND